MYLAHLLIGVHFIQGRIFLLKVNVFEDLVLADRESKTILFFFLFKPFPIVIPLAYYKDQV